MPNRMLVMPRPNEKQHLALTEKHRYVGYGGARGGGPYGRAQSEPAAPGLNLTQQRAARQNAQNRPANFGRQNQEKPNNIFEKRGLCGIIFVKSATKAGDVAPPASKKEGTTYEIRKQ